MNGDFKSKFQLAPIFQNGMMLQRDKDIVVWGTSEADATIKAEIGSVRGQTVSGKNGAWRVTLGKLSSSLGVELKVYNESTGEEIRVENIAVGEIWMASGQSNMEFLMKYDADRYPEFDKEENKNIRFYDVPHLAFEGDSNPVSHQGIWRTANAENLPYYPAAAYYFARDLQQALGIPIGIVGCNWGGTTALTWIRRSRLQQHPVLKKYWDEFCVEAAKTPEDEYETRYKECMQTYRKFDARYADHVMYGISWKQQVEHMERLKTLPPLPVGKWDVNAPGNLFDSMVNKIAGFAVRGVLWYQGEGDWMRANDYACLFEEVTASWREAWDEELPFLTVQLAPFYKWLGEEGREYPTVRRQQEKASKEISGVWMISSSDCGMKWDIHPKRKQPLGERLALLARGKIYGEDIVCQTPECRHAFVDRDKIVLEFTETGDGLKKLDSIQRGLYVYYEDKCAEAIELECEGNRIIVKNPETGLRPEKVTFMNSAYGECMIYSSAGIPLKPFEVEVES